MNRSDLQLLARTRIREARVLLRNGYYDSAYYLAGFAVECALKACIARQTKRYDFPDRDTVRDSYGHNLARLLGVAGLQAAFDRDRRLKPALDDSWATVRDWTNENRYNVTEDTKARQLYAAITNRRYGVLPWIKQHW